MKAFGKILLLAVTVGLAAFSTAAGAQEYPAKPIHLIVGFAAGGGR